MNVKTGKNDGRTLIQLEAITPEDKKIVDEAIKANILMVSGYREGESVTFKVLA